MSQKLLVWAHERRRRAWTPKLTFLNSGPPLTVYYQDTRYCTAQRSVYIRPKWYHHIFYARSCS